MEFGTDYQRELVAKLCSKSFMERTGYLLQPGMFQPDLAGVVEKCLDRFRKGRATLSRAQLKQLCQREGVKLASTNGAADSEFDHEEILRFARYQVIKQAQIESVACREEGDFDGAVEALSRARQDLPRANREEVLDVLTSNRPEPRRRNLLATGVDRLDEFLGGGVAAGELATVMAPTSGGKSTWLVNQAAEAILAGRTVFYSTLEVPDFEIEGKLRRRLLGRKSATKATWEKHARKLRKNKARLYVRAYPPRSVSVSELNGDFPQGVDVVLVDYADYVRPPSGTLSTDYQNLGFIYEELKRVAMERNIPVWTASQVNRAAYGSGGMLGLKDTEMSLRKAMVSDQVITLNQDEFDREEDETGTSAAVIYIAKNRHGARYKEIRVAVNWGLGWFKGVRDS